MTLCEDREGDLWVGTFAGVVRLGRDGARLQVSPGELRIRVDDDDRGFDLGSPAGHGNGLRNMRDRLGSVGGTTLVQSEPGHGTSVEFRVPLPFGGAGQ